MAQAPVLRLQLQGVPAKSSSHLVDVFYAKWSDRRKAFVNLLGALFFLLPFCLIVIKAGIPYVKTSFLMNESSSDPGGLPARYMIKSFIIIGYVFLLLQAFTMMIESLFTLMGKSSLITSKITKSE